MANNKDKNILSSVNHALKVLDLLCVRADLGVSEISRITGYDKASVYKMLYTLQHRGYVVKDENAKYNISEKLAVSSLPAERQNVSDLAAPYLKKLRDDTRETVFLGVLNTNGKVVLLNKEDGFAPGSLKVPLAYELDSYTTALGKVLLAHLDKPFQDAMLDILRLEPHTPETITDLETLKAELKEDRNAPYVLEYEQNYPGHSDIAAPIFDENGRVAAALSVGCSVETMKKKSEVFAERLVTAASVISSLMGYKS